MSISNASANLPMVSRSGVLSIEDDIVKVYGTYLGMETVYRVIGGQDEVPAVAIKYAEIKQ